MEANFHIITGQIAAAKNIYKCVNRANLEATGLILEPLASAEAVLSKEEKEAGVALVDIGGGTTDIAVFADGAIKHTAVIPIAGDQVTNDIAVALRTPTQNAEDIKRKHACALTQMANIEESIEVASIGERPPRRISAQNLAEIIGPRYEELMLLVQAELRRSGFEDCIAAGVVLTGGSSKVKGLVELAEEIFHIPVRVGIPQHVQGLAEVIQNPIYSTGVGLLIYGKERFGSVGGMDNDGEGFFAKIKNWFQGNF
jgi:cell division protein FtsA